MCELSGFSFVMIFCHSNEDDRVSVLVLMGDLLVFVDSFIMFFTFDIYGILFYHLLIVMQF
ncbi:hypothetical protein DDZ16_02840 [Marinilabilia rubra]|uniref:Uncharacterized protein n=1 Tax=Marinilabilia rubra TaxID=2162893 RepID=A0A2U2BEF4_9BACT|nr:hypothetical protein DDZ16_02840 [Marinilabilia rubra]